MNFEKARNIYTHLIDDMGGELCQNLTPTFIMQISNHIYMYDQLKYTFTMNFKYNNLCNAILYPLNEFNHAHPSFLVQIVCSFLIPSITEFKKKQDLLYNLKCVFQDFEFEDIFVSRKYTIRPINKMAICGKIIMPSIYSFYTRRPRVTRHMISTASETIYHENLWIQTRGYEQSNGFYEMPYAMFDLLNLQPRKTIKEINAFN